MLSSLTIQYSPDDPSASSLPPLPGSDPSHGPGTHPTRGHPGSGGGDGATETDSSGSGFSFNDFLPVLDRPPERVGPYKIIREVGHGGMGTVLLAVRDDDKFHRRVAVKLIRRGMDTAGVLRRFQLERQVLSALNHPNIARIFDAGATDDGRPYFVMEYVEGLPIDKFCDAAELDVHERLVLFQKVCAAVQHAHQNLIVHRDLKPSNVLVGGDGEPKLVDFGIAKLLNPDIGGLTMGTAADIGPMTPEYASPEQIKGEPVGTASDVYGLGALLYELLTGRRPFKGIARDALAQAIINQEPDRPSTAVTRDDVEERNGTTVTRTADQIARSRGGKTGVSPARLKRRLSGDIDNIVLMAMRKSARRRYSSAQQFADDIQRHLDGKPVIAVPESWVYVAGKFVKRNRALVGATALVALSITGAAVGMGVAWQRADAERERADSKADEAEAAKERAEQTATVARSLKSLAGDFVSQSLGLLSRGESEDSTAEKLSAISQNWANGIAALEAENPGVPIDLRGELLSAKEQYARFLTGVRGAGTGRLSDAIKILEEVVTERRSRAAAVPESPERVLELSHALILRSDALRALRRRGEAIAGYDEVVRTLSDAARSTGDDATSRQRTLAVALNARGTMRVEDGETSMGMSDLRHSLQLREKLMVGAPESAALMRDIAIGYASLANAMANVGEWGQASEAYRESIRWRREIRRIEDSARTRRDLMVAIGKYLDVLLDDNPESREIMRLAHEHLSAAEEGAKDESDRRAQEDLLEALRRMGAARAAALEYSEAQDYFERGRKQMRAVLDRWPDSVNAKFSGAKVLVWKARVHEHLQEFSEAQSSYTEAKQEFEALAGASGLSAMMKDQITGEIKSISESLADFGEPAR